jgi:glycosyltransferase involved in cell wall biosynthesis
MSTEAPVVTVLVCTYDRCKDLEEMLCSALRQTGAGESEYEILVVDNNSTDQTRATVERLASNARVPLRYLFEPQQGKSFALNAGVDAARGTYYAVIDDDLIMPDTYVRDLVAAIREFTGVAAVAGKVLPLYEGRPPVWLTKAHWAPIAMADLGERSIRVGSQRPICLMAATLRRAAVLAVGAYRTDLGVRGRKVVGGTEDAELMRRLWSAGLEGLYVPQLVLYHKVDASRLTTAYFRRWHFGHGRSRARERDPGVEKSRARLFDVPVHMYGAAIKDVVGYLGGRLSRRTHHALHHQFQLCFFAGFVRERLPGGRTHSARRA